MSGSVDSKPLASTDDTRFQSAAIYLALGPSASSKRGISIEPSVSESSNMPPVTVASSASSTSFKRAYSAEHAKATDGNKLPANRPKKRSKLDLSISAKVRKDTHIFSKSSANVETTMVKLPPPVYAGNLDLYGMFLPLLYNVYLPEGITVPQYESLYKTLVRIQAKHDHSARCFLTPPSNLADSTSVANAYNSSVTNGSRFESPTMIDPMTEKPYDIQVCNIIPRKTLPFAPNTEYSSFAAPEASSSAPGPGISARLSLPDQCGIKSSKGVFKMKRVWAKLTPEGVLEELFEGFFSFSISFDSLYKKAGHGNGARYKYAFWAIRTSTGADGSDVQGQP